MAALCQAWPLAHAGTITQSFVPAEEVDAVATASTALQEAIQAFAADPSAANAAAVTTAQTAYNTEIETNSITMVTGASTVSESWNVPSGEASVIFAPSGNSLTFGSSSRVTNAGMFFLGNSSPSAQPFTFSGITAPDLEGGALNNSGTATIAGGSFSGNTAGHNTGTSSGVHNGGAIANSGTITIIGSSFTGNEALGLNTGNLNNAGGGGAIINSGTVTIFGSNFTSNEALGPGGAILNNTTLTIANSDFVNNKSGQGGSGAGGALNNFSGAAVITNTNFENNVATTFGGAISNAGGGSAV